MDKIKTNEDINKIFDELHHFYVWSVEHFKEKWADELPKIDEHIPIIVGFYILQSLGLAYLQDRDEDLVVFYSFISASFEKLFRCKLSIESSKLIFGSMIDMGTKTMRIKTDFVKDIQDFKKKYKKDSLASAVNNLLPFWTDEICFISNVCGNYIFYPGLSFNNINSVTSPFEKFKDEFSSFVQFVIAADIVYSCLGLIEKLFD